MCDEPKLSKYHIYMCKLLNIAIVDVYVVLKKICCHGNIRRDDFARKDIRVGLRLHTRVCPELLEFVQLAVMWDSWVVVWVFGAQPFSTYSPLTWLSLGPIPALCWIPVSFSFLCVCVCVCYPWYSFAC